jgi:hypothetical protein
MPDAYRNAGAPELERKIASLIESLHPEIQPAQAQDAASRVIAEIISYLSR